MIKKLIIRLSIVSTYFIIDIIYFIWKNNGQIKTDALIEKSFLFLGVGISVYLLTKKNFNSKGN